MLKRFISAALVLITVLSSFSIAAGAVSRDTYNDVFASLKGRGYSLSSAKASKATSFKKGDMVYVWAWVHDADNNLYKSYNSGTCDMTLSIYRPNGSCAYTYTYKNSDNNWIGQKLNQVGTWKIQSKVSGSISGTNTRTITVKDVAPTPKGCYLTYNANGGSNAPSFQMVKPDKTFNLSTAKPARPGYTFLGWSTDKNAVSAAYSPGSAIQIKKNTTLYAVWRKNLWRTGLFDSGYTAKGYTTIKLDNTTETSYIYIYTYDINGKKTKGKMHITLRDSNGKWLWEGDVTGGSRLKLGKNHSEYRVYIAKKSYPSGKNMISSAKNSGDDFANIGKCHSWAINSKNCYIV